MSWRNPDFRYIPAAAHNDAAHFRRRMQLRAKAAEIARRQAAEQTAATVRPITRRSKTA